MLTLTLCVTTSYQLSMDTNVTPQAPHRVLLKTILKKYYRVKSFFFFFNDKVGDSSSSSSSYYYYYY